MVRFVEKMVLNDAGEDKVVRAAPVFEKCITEIVGGNMAVKLIPFTEMPIFDLLVTINDSAMSQKEREEFARKAVAHRKKVTATAAASKEFLITIGVLTPSGNIRRRAKQSA